MSNNTSLEDRSAPSPSIPLTPPQFLIDNQGNRLAVVLDPSTYEALYDAYEELQDIRDAEETLAALERGDEMAIPLEQAVAEIEATWADRERHAA